MARQSCIGNLHPARRPGRRPDPNGWETITYAYDSAGRRIEKAYDGTTVMKYLYDGDHIIAEYDGNNTLLHKYIYGPGVDQPICMIDVNDANATYYYHFDGLGSVIALTNSAGSVANLYEYSVYGQVSASDPNHPNRFLFTGREFDKETGLYYYRARYYNPYIGRFLQTDPARAGMNPYTYVGNDPVGLTDPSGLDPACDNDAALLTGTTNFMMSFPPDVIGDYVTSENVWGLTDQYFGATRGYNVLRPFRIWDVHLGDDGNVHVWWFTTSKDPNLKKVGWRTAWAKVHDGPEEDEGQHLVGKYPFLVVGPDSSGDSVGLLSLRTLFRIIKPTLEGLSKYPTNPLFPHYYAWKWDSWFKSDSGSCRYYQVEAFFWAKTKYDFSEINYIVGGWNFRQLGIPESSAEFMVLSWKELNRKYKRRPPISPDDPAVLGVMTFFWFGYDWWPTIPRWY